MRSISKIIGVLSFGAALFSVPTVATSGPFNGSVIGTFINPVTSGFIVEPNGSGTYYNNTGTSAVTGLGSNIMSWGTNTPHQASLVGFIGETLSNQLPDESFFLGTIIFSNQTSTLESLIFGAQLKVQIPGVDDLFINMGITTTNNGLVDPFQDADFLTFSGLGTNLSLGAFEGQTVSAKLFGQIVGDPQLFLTDITLFGPADENFGFIGAAPVATPIPAALPLFAAGLGVIGLAARRRKQKAAAA